MIAHEIEQKRQELIEEYGPFNHNVLLTDGIYTIGENSLKDATRLKLVVQLVSDLTRKPIEELRILDLGCANGLYAIEFARLGAQVVGIEGREANVKKADFMRDVLELNNLHFYEADVRTLSQERYGTFDIVLCIGILYHLDGPSAIEFMEQIAEVCTGLAIIDTHISFSAEINFTHAGNTYWGKTYHEFIPGTDARRMLSASLDNTESFWPTVPSLMNLIKAVGFTSAYECWLPVKPVSVADRITFVAIKGEPAQVISIPLINEQPVQPYSEELPTALSYGPPVVTSVASVSTLAVVPEAPLLPSTAHLETRLHELEGEWVNKTERIAYLEKQLTDLNKGKVLRTLNFVNQRVRKLPFFKK